MHRESETMIPGSREYEIVEHNIIQNFQVFLVDIVYRTAHIHSDFEVACLVKGSASVKIDGKPLFLHAPDFFVVNPFSVHEVSTSGPATFLSIQVRPSFFRGYYPEIEDMHFSFCSAAKISESNKSPLLKGTLDYIFSIAYAYFSAETGFPLYCAGMLNQLFFFLIRNMPTEKISPNSGQAHRRQMERLRRISSYIHDNYEKKLFLSDIARQEGLTMTYLSHLFRDYFQMPFKEYLMRIRCEKARQLLLLTDLNLLEISVMCGFSDTKYLNKGFLKIYGMLPKELRRTEHSGVTPKNCSPLSLQHFYSPEESLTYLKNPPAIPGYKPYFI